jgi:hypothetical protein
MRPHLHIAAISILINALGVIAVLYVLNLVAVKFKDRSRVAAAYANGMGLN